MTLSQSPMAPSQSAVFVQRIVRQLARPGEVGGPAFDLLDIAWNERGRRSLLRRTRGGKLLRIILPADQSLDHGDVLIEQSDWRVLVNLLPCEALVVSTDAPADLARFAYLVGNAHLPAEILESSILIPASTSTAAALGQLRIPYRMQTRQVRIDPTGLAAATISENIAIRSNARPPGGS